ncbi:hypothetical protein BJ170DRAFT_726489 [Xylariales sp. AK1849]|nr:hypothetical protein BJ170DRAFT_726489 [Xylariales sp. AK1849]
MAEDTQRQSRLRQMAENTPAGSFSYNSPLALQRGYGRTGLAEEIDLADFETRQSRSSYSPESPPTASHRHSDVPSIRVDPPVPWESRFKEIFRSVSTQWKQNGPSRPLLSALRDSDDPNDLHPHTEYDGRQTEFEVDALSKRYSRAPTDCHSRQDAHIKRWTWLYMSQLIMSLYSTFASGMVIYLSLRGMRYGHAISWGSQATITPDGAANLPNYIYKSIEITFVAVFVSFIGQILTRRAFSRTSNAINIAEMTMRNWVNQPGSIFTHWEGVPHAGGTILGVLTLLATFGTVFHTTACTGLVTPKLFWSDWEQHGRLTGLVKTSYANHTYIKSTCPIIDIVKTDYNNYGQNCLDVEFSGQSYVNLLAFLKSWQNIHDGLSTLHERPNGTAILYGNTTLISAWISDNNPAFELDGRLINNVSLAMPHAGLSGVYAGNDSNAIVKPSELSGQNGERGGYQIMASVVSPAVNVMCVNAAPSDLKPIVGSKADNSSKTPLDDTFEWGDKFGRYRPAFSMFPIAFNTVTDTQIHVQGADSIYLLANYNDTGNYTLCQIRSFITPICSTYFEVSATSGEMRAVCNEISREDAYLYSAPDAGPTVSTDWRDIAVQWRLSMDMNGGVTKNNASNARLLTNLVLQEPELPNNLPSIAEALAVYAGSTLVAGSLDSTYRHKWFHATFEESENFTSGLGVLEVFNATYRSQQYTSAHSADLPIAEVLFFYAVVVIVLVINLLCLVYHMCRTGLVTDFTEPQNLFALAINSPPSDLLQGACGRGPESKYQGIPFRVAYQESTNHYFFEDAHDAPARSAAKRLSRLSTATGSSQAVLLADGTYSSSYKRLSSSRPLL